MVSSSGERLLLETKDDRAVRVRADGVRETYDPRGRLIARDYRNGNVFLWRYAPDGRLSEISGPRGSFFRLAFDAAGRVTRIDTSTGATARYVYAKEDLAEVQVNGGPPVRYSYSDKGLLMKMHRPASGAVEFSYDGRLRVTRRRWADGAEERYEYDDSGSIARRIDPAGGVTATRWSSDGRREEITDPLGGTTTVECDEAGRPVSMTGPTGATTRFAYDSIGRKVAVENSGGQVTRLQYVGDTRLLKNIVHPDGSLQAFEYDAHHNPTAIREGAETLRAFSYYQDGLLAAVKEAGAPERRFAYHPDGRLKSETTAPGRSTSYEYDKRGNRIRGINPLGGITLYEYDGQDRVVGITDPLGGRHGYVYDAVGRLAQVSDPTGGITRYEYDGRGRVRTKTDPTGRATRYQYVPNGRVSSVTYPGGGAYKFAYDPAGNLASEVNPLGGVTRYTYDPLGRVSGVTDPAGRTWAYEYSPTGQLARVIEPGGGTIEYAYDPKGRREAVTDPAGQTLRFERDGKGRVAKIAYPGGIIRDLVYDSHGRLAGRSDNMGVGTRYEYDAQGQLVRETHAQGLEVHYQYDAAGNPTTMRNNLGGALSIRYNPGGLATEMTDAAGAGVTYRYDLSGRVVEIADPLGQVRHFSYNAAGDLVEAREANGDTATFGYDGAGLLKTIRHAGHGVTQYERDLMGNLVRVTDPIGNSVQHVYDKAGRLVRTVNAKGESIVFLYDGGGRLRERKYSTGKVITYSYDSSGRLIAVDDGSFPVRYAYDAAGNRVRIDYPAIQRSLQYEYDAAGLLTQFTSGDGRPVGYEYDTYKRLSAIRLPGGERITFGYDAADRQTALVYPNGVRGTWEYDGSGNIRRVAYTSTSAERVAGWDYTHDGAGNPTRIVRADGRVTEYTYDPSGQLIKEQDDKGATTYTYLPGGSRRTLEGKGKKVQYQHNQADQLTRAGDETFAYDANGNLVERRGPAGATRYEYDADDRLVKVVLPDKEAVTFGYAPTGERIWRRDKNGRTWFVTDGRNVVAELDESLQMRASYVHAPGIDRPIVMALDGRPYYYHADALGTIASLTDMQGRTAARYEVDAFGNITAADNALKNPFVFTAREYERDLGIYYYRARYYDPTVGRFLAKDPDVGSLSDPLTLNLYAYVNNSPTRYRDPLGFGLFPSPPTNFGNLSYKDFGLSREQWLRLVNLQENAHKLAEPGMAGVYSRTEYEAWVVDRLNAAEMKPGSRAPSELFSKVRGDIIKDYDEHIYGQGSGAYGRPQSRGALEAWQRDRLTVMHDPQGQVGAGSSSESGRTLSQRPGAPGGRPADTPPGEPPIGRPPRDPSGASPAPPEPPAPGGAPGGGPRGPGGAAPSGGGPGGPPLISPSNVAGGVGNVLGAVATYFDYQGCIDAGNSQLDCAKSTILALGAACAAGYIAVQTLVAAAAVLGISAAAIGPILAAGGVVLAGYSAYGALDRWSGAPEVRALEEQRRAQRDLLMRATELSGSIQGDLGRLQELQRTAMTTCQEVTSKVNEALQAAQDSRNLLASLRGLAAPAAGPVSRCADAAAIRAEIDALQSRAQGGQQSIVNSLNAAQAMAGRCATREDADRIRAVYDSSYGSLRDVTQCGVTAQMRNEQLQAMLAQGVGGPSAQANAQQIKGRMAANAARAQTIAASTIPRIESLKEMQAQLESQKAALAGRLRTLRQTLSDQPPSEEYKVAFSSVTADMSTIQTQVGATPPVGCAADAGALAAARIDAENLYSQAESLVAAMSDRPQACDVTAAEGAVDTIKASAQLSLYAVGNIAQMVADCQARVASAQGDRGGGGSPAVSVDTVLGMFGDARAGRTVPPSVTGAGPPPSPTPDISPPGAGPQPGVMPPGGWGTPGGPSPSGNVYTPSGPSAPPTPWAQPGTAPAAPTNPTTGTTTPASPATGTRQAQPPTITAKPSTPAPVDNRRWYVWHECGPKTGWWCNLHLTRTTEADLKKQKNVTVLASYQTEDQARGATCGQMSGFYRKGEFSAGSLAVIGGHQYCVVEFGVYDEAQKRFTCYKPRGN
jgi:RHS repeat-associated protein